MLVDGSVAVRGCNGRKDGRSDDSIALTYKTKPAVGEVASVQPAGSAPALHPPWLASAKR
jgi:hypothetical protein